MPTMKWLDGLIRRGKLRVDIETGEILSDKGVTIAPRQVSILAALPPGKMLTGDTGFRMKNNVLPL